MGYQIGVDLGTTYTAAAINRDGRAEVLQLGSTSPVMPSVVLLREDGRLIVGDAAIRRAIDEPTRVAREFKRRLGDPAPLVLGRTPFSPDALMARLLAEVLALATEREGERPAGIVLTHPANFGPYKMDVMREVARQAGVDLTTLRFVTEPRAAAMSYAMRNRVEPGEVVAVYDFGGGTFDAAVLRRDGADFELVGEPDGIDRFGGMDIDAAVLAFVDDALDGRVSALDTDQPETRARLNQLIDECRSAKEALSSDTEATVLVSLPDVQTRIRLTRSELEVMVRPRIRETVNALRRTVASAGLQMDDISRILLVGGTSRIPIIGQALQAETGRPTAVDAHPKLAIALGAAQLPAIAAARPAPAATPVPPPPADAAPAAAAALPPPVRAVDAGPSSPPPVPPFSTVSSPSSGGGPNRRALLIGVGSLVVVALVILGIVIGTRGDDGAADSPTTGTEAPSSTKASTSTAPTSTDLPETTVTATSGATTVLAPPLTVDVSTTTLPPSFAGASGMKLTIDIDPAAVWDDGTPITVKDFQCTLDAVMNTPNTLSTVGYDQITSIQQGQDDHEVVVTLKSVLASYKNLFSNPGPLKAAAFPNGCNDVSAEMQTSIPFSSRPYKMQSWSPDQEVLVRNDAYWGADVAKVSKVVMVPLADSDIEVAALKSGEVDFIFPQAFAGLESSLAASDVQVTPGFGNNFEALWFQQRSGPFADAAFREGFAHMVDRDQLLQNIYQPILAGATLLNCGPWVPTVGNWCDQSIFAAFHDQAAGEQLLTDGGYTKNADGLWQKDGTVPQIRWMVNAGNSRRENAQALMIPQFRALGFDVVADNCDAACVFQTRLPALDYDLGMYILSALPDPSVTAILACDSIPTDANAGGQNVQGWCNQDATNLMHASDREIDLATHESQIHQVGAALAADAVMLPLFQFPNLAAWRTDRLGGPVDADASNFQAFQNINEWTVSSGDQFTIGAEQWASCLNPITDCAIDVWMLWTTAFKVLNNVWDTTATGQYVPTSLVAGEPTIEPIP